MASAAQPSSEGDFVAAARGLAPLIREHADESERERRLAKPVVDAFAANGLYRLAAPKSVGGHETHPFVQIEAIEAASQADGASGWNLMIGIENMGFLGAALEREVATQLFSDPAPATTRVERTSVATRRSRARAHFQQFRRAAGVSSRRARRGRVCCCFSAARLARPHTTRREARVSPDLSAGRRVRPARFCSRARRSPRPRRARSVGG